MTHFHIWSNTFLLQAMLRGALRKAFSGFDLLMLGLGIVMGTGAFTLTGQAQAQYAGYAGRSLLH